ncbi:MAG: 3'(2'),5'-bisphosphate nucleotidase CysQ [Planctomycetota bacterium]
MTSPADPLRVDLEFAIAAARWAGRRALRLARSGRWQAETLGDVGDQACDALLQGLITGRYEEDGLLSEETKDTAERLAKSRVWIVDPLDGTKEYRSGRADWAVHVGLVVDGACHLGAVALPAQDRLIWGVCAPGQAAAGVEGQGSLLAGDEPRTGPLRLAVSRSHTPPWVERLAETLGAELVPCGSVGNKVSLLLDGQADAYVHREGLKEWDTCAPECIARALDWHVSRLDGSTQRYNQRDVHNNEFLVCRPADRDRLLGALADLDL